MKDMKTLTKEEILAAIEFSARNKTLNERDYKKLIYKAMQEFSDQENARLTAIIEKQAELINRFLKGNLQVPIRDYSAYQKLKDELFSLQAGPTAVEMVRDAFEPIQLGESEVVNYALEHFVSIKAGKENKCKVQDFMTDVHKWADETFGTERTALAPLYHLKKEVDEAIETMQTHNSWLTVEELADCFILILNSSSKYGLTFDELLTAAKDKMIKNKARKWGKPDDNGVVEHIRS